MAGITDLPTRRIMEKFDIGLSFSEMINAKNLDNASGDTVKKLQDHRLKLNSVFAVQLAGNNCEELKLACRIACDQGADLIDFNLGCPVKRVVNGYGGSSLLKDIELVKRLISTIVESVKVPVTIKCRLGWDKNSLTAPEIVMNAERLGVSLVSIHARTRDQFFKGVANWNFVKRIKEKVNIPLIINGDILCEKSAIRALKDSDCDGIMIGRGLMGNPWLIKKLSKKVFNIEAERNDTASKISILEEHVEGIYSFYGTRLGNLKARKHIKWYLKNFDIPQSFQKELLNCTEKSKLFSLLRVLEIYEN